MDRIIRYLLWVFTRVLPIMRTCPRLTVSTYVVTSVIIFCCLFPCCLSFMNSMRELLIFITLRIFIIQPIIYLIKQGEFSFGCMIPSLHSAPLSACAIFIN